MVERYNTDGMPNDMPLEEWLWLTGQTNKKKSNQENDEK